MLQSKVVAWFCEPEGPGFNQLGVWGTSCPSLLMLGLRDAVDPTKIAPPAPEDDGLRLPHGNIWH